MTQRPCIPMSSEPFATLAHVPIPFLRTPVAFIPPITDPVALYTLYTRVLWVSIARLDQTIYHTLLVTTVENKAKELSVSLIDDTNDLVSACRTKRAEYLQLNRDVFGRLDDAALVAMRGFILHIIDQEKSNETPEFEFLFEP
jgi:hypothetical protein